VVEAGTHGPIGSTSLYAVDPAVGVLLPLTVEPAKGCRIQQPGRPSRLPDGQLGYVVTCVSQPPPGRFTAFARSLSDPTPSRLAELADYNPSVVASNERVGLLEVRAEEVADIRAALPVLKSAQRRRRRRT
jgi:hypothetical protein